MYYFYPFLLITELILYNNKVFIISPLHFIYFILIFPFIINSTCMIVFLIFISYFIFCKIFYDMYYFYFCINYYYIYSFDYFYPFLRSFRRFSENSTSLTFFLNFLILFSFLKFFNEMYYFYLNFLNYICLTFLSYSLYLFVNYVFIFFNQK